MLQLHRDVDRLCLLRLYIEDVGSHFYIWTAKSAQRAVTEVRTEESQQHWLSVWG